MTGKMKASSSWAKLAFLRKHLLLEILPQAFSFTTAIAAAFIAAVLYSRYFDFHLCADGFALEGSHFERDAGRAHAEDV